MSEQEDSVGSYLGKIEEGHKDSTGQFTIDWTKARRRFASESRKDPARYLLFLAQFALASRPEQIDIEVDSKALTLRWQPGQKTDVDELRKLFAGLEKGELAPATGALFYLRHVLLLLASRDDLSLSYNEPGIASLDLSPTEMGLGAPTAVGTFARLRLQPGVTRPETCPLWKIDLLHPFISTHWTELGHLRETLSFPDCVVTLNGSKISCTNGAPNNTLFCWATRASSSGPGFLLQTELPGDAFKEVRDQQGQIVEKVYFPQRYNSLYLVGEFGQPNGTQKFRSELNLVQDGRIVHTAYCPAFGMVIFCATRGLKMDADGIQAVESPERELVVKRAQAEALEYYAEVERRSEGLAVWQGLTGIPKRLKFLADARACS